MSIIEGVLDLQKFDFTDTSFDLLMQKRIHRVLIICSNYDNYMLEEDGRIDEQIFNEYVSLNLRFPPTFVQTDNADDAFRILAESKIDLVISMLSLRGTDVFALARQIKEKYENIPIVVLTYFSREVSIRLEGEDLSAIDYVFCWLGDASLILAIIKLLEDKMNAEFDIENIGVQAIILVENSIRYISSYLPNLYRIVLMQSRDFQREALNEHQRMLKMRGRPKILLANNFNDALALYKKYKYSVLGIISDISYKRDGVTDENAGIERLDQFFLRFRVTAAQLIEKVIAVHHSGFGPQFLFQGIVAKIGFRDGFFPVQFHFDPQRPPDPEIGLENDEAVF